jgi:dGTPase
MKTHSNRLSPEGPRNGDDRNDYQHDRDIILYSSALQRLSTTTQVVSGTSGYVFHNRLTHTLQVAQVGRRLAEKLLIHQKEFADHHQINPDVVEAACLAHDLGHPPFGHLAETELNTLAMAGKAIEGFEGNAQSFRIVTQLAFRSEKFRGLNLTDRTLRAILKYPWMFSDRPKDKQNKWGAYKSELPSFRLAMGGVEKGPFHRSAEAELMDWADDLTYAIHDVEDFYRAGLVPLHLLKYPKSVEKDRFLNYVMEHKAKIGELKSSQESDLNEVLEDLLSLFAISGPYEGARRDRALLRTFTSQLVGRYINGIHLTEPNRQGATVSVDSDLRVEIALLKQLTWYYVIEAPGLTLQQHAQRKIITNLFEIFHDEAQKPSPTALLPPYYRERLKRSKGYQPDPAKRVAIDLIAGMTEAQALMTFQKLNGIVMPSGLDRAAV